MRASRQNVHQMYYDYIFHNAFERFSQEMLLKTDNSHALRISQGVSIRHNIDQKYREQVPDGKLDYAKYIDLINKEFSLFSGEDVQIFDVDNPVNDKYFKQLNREFINYTGFNNLNKSISQKKDGMIPISCYSPVFGNLSNVANSPGMMFVSSADIVDKNDSIDTIFKGDGQSLRLSMFAGLHTLSRSKEGELYFKEVKKGSDVVDTTNYDEALESIDDDLYDDIDEREENNLPDSSYYEYNDSGKPRYMMSVDERRLDNRVNLNTLADIDDISKLSRFTKYMTQTEYNDIRSWYNDKFLENWQNMSARDLDKQLMSDRDIEKSVAILDYLDENGYEYKIRRDSKPGQIKVSVSDPKLDVRLSDTVDNSQYIGRVYANGLVMRYSTDRKITSNGSQKMDSYDPTPAEAVDLVRYSLGETVKYRDRSIGQFGFVRKPDNQIRRNKNPHRTYVATNSGYYTSKNYVTNYKTLSDGSHVVIRGEYNAKSSRIPFVKDKFVAASQLHDSVLSARENFIAQLDLDNLIEASNKNGPDYFKNKALALKLGEAYEGPELIGDFEYSNNPDIRELQESYWKALNDREFDLYKPSKGLDLALDELQEPLDKISTIGGQSESALFIESQKYEGYDEDIVRKHANDYLNYYIGNFDYTRSDDSENAEIDINLDEYGETFNPTHVAKYMDLGRVDYHNDDYLVANLRELDITGDQLKRDEDDFNNNRMIDRIIKFNPNTARRFKDLANERALDEDNPSSFMQDMYDSVVDSLKESSIVFNENEIYIDDNGVVEYKVFRPVKQNVNIYDNNLGNNLFQRSDFVELTGTIGQILEPEANGMVKTKFNGSNNYVTAPGYTATVIPAKVGDYSDMIDRSLLSGYEEKMKRTIKYQIKSDLLTNNNSKCGEGASLNVVLRRLQEERYPEDFYNQKMEEGMEVDELEAIISAQVNTVHYSSALGQNSTLNAYIRNERVEDRLRNKAIAGDDLTSFVVGDRYKSYFTDTGYENLAIITELSNGAFDPVFTPSGNKQGLNRVLVESAQVVDGKIIKGDLNDKAYMTKFFGDNNFFDYDPQNRQAMTLSNLLRASRIAKDVETIMSDFGGKNQEDGLVVSKEFAQTYQVRGKDGTMRDLIIGDKLSDEHGDKGVITSIIDRDMDLDEAREKGIEKAVLTFKNNPNLGVVTSPYAAISRHNAGSLHELMQNTKDFVAWDGTVYEDSIGTQRWIITHMNVDQKTIEYGEEDAKQGKSRKASSQLAWAMDSVDATEIMKEFYGNNERGYLDLREYMIVCGLDIDEFGNLSDGYKAHDGETRKVFDMPEFKYKPTKNGQQRVDLASMREDFVESITNEGGFMKIPFPISYGFIDKNTGKMKMTEKSEDGGYLLPLMSSHLRTGQDFTDGRVASHDYTNYYSRIFTSVVNYQVAHDQFLLPIKKQMAYASNVYKNMNPAEQVQYRDRYQNKMNELQTKYRSEFNGHCKVHVDKAQKYYEAITNDVKDKRFTGKHNVFKDNIMSNPLNKSVTAVWSSDSKLKINQIGMNKSMMDGMGVSEGESILMWRDPILRDGGVRYLEVVENNDLTGISINPTIVKSYAGDFDGDSGGGKALESKKAKAEAYEKFSQEANLLDYSASPDENGFYPLYIADDLDITTAQYYNENLKKRWDKVSKDVNVFEKYYAGVLAYVADDEAKIAEVKDKLFELRKNAVDELSDITMECFNNTYSTAVISFKSPEDCFKSIVETNIKTGAKGSYGKLRDTMKYFGVSDGKDEGEIDFDNFTVANHTLATREDLINTLRAQDVKNTGTGFAGKVPQRAIKALRNAEPVRDNKHLINFNAKDDYLNMSIDDMEKIINKDQNMVHNIPKSVLESTEPITQAILSAKHNPIQALKTFSSLSGTTRPLWRGKKVEKVMNETGESVWDVVYEDGQEVTMKRDEWVDAIVKYYDDPDALGVGVNRAHIEEIADVLADKDGFIRDIENIDDLLDMGASPMDLMAYDGNFDLLVELSEKNMDFYGGKRNECFAPNNIRYNREIKHVLDNPDLYTEKEYDKALHDNLRSVLKSDTRDYDKELSEQRAINEANYFAKKNDEQVLNDALDICDNLDVDDNNLESINDVSL